MLSEKDKLVFIKHIQYNTPLSDGNNLLLRAYNWLYNTTMPNNSKEILYEL